MTDTILHLTENISFASGGVRPVLINLNNYINKNFADKKSVIITNHKEPLDTFLEFKSYKFKSWYYSNELKQYLESYIVENMGYHLHGVFMHTQFIPSKIAKKNNVPFVISPHGMLEPWHLNDKKLKKSIYLNLFLKEILKSSKILHAITPLEKENLYQLTNHKNIFEIPNFIVFDDVPKSFSYNNKEEDYLLFLGRLHPKKGLDIIIEAMTKIVDKKIKLKIVGAENTYSENIKKKCASLGLLNRVEFTGSVYGDEKYKLFSQAKAFLAPSFSEAIGMVNLEAAACKTPVLTTYNTGLNPAWNSNGGVLINPLVHELVTAINAITSWTTSEREERGLALSNFVLTNYSWEKKGYLWDELYNTL